MCDQASSYHLRFESVGVDFSPRRLISIVFLTPSVYLIIMRLTVNIGSDNLRIPIDEGSKTIAWLQAEIIRRWEKMHKGEYLNIHEIRTVLVHSHSHHTSTDITFVCS